MQIAPEAMYQYIYVLPRGSLKKILIAGLRRSHQYRRSPRQEKQDNEMRGKIADMLSIHERPREVADRTVPGHWELTSHWFPMKICNTLKTSLMDDPGSV